MRSVRFLVGVMFIITALSPLMSIYDSSANADNETKTNPFGEPRNDIALIRLAEPVPLFSEDQTLSAAEPICLSWDSEVNKEDEIPGRNLKVKSLSNIFLRLHSFWEAQPSKDWFYCCVVVLSFWFWRC